MYKQKRLELSKKYKMTRISRTKLRGEGHVARVYRHAPPALAEPSPPRLCLAGAGAATTPLD